MRYSDIRQIASSDSEADDQTTAPPAPQPRVAICAPVCRALPESVECNPPPCYETVSLDRFEMVRRGSCDATRSELPPCSVPLNPPCSVPLNPPYTTVSLGPVSDISALAMLSDTDSTVSTTPEIMCRICRSEPGSEKIISPCYCAGSLQYVHQSCLLKWLKAYDCVNKHHCELCQYEFKLKPKPWMEWRMPALSVTEQRRATCLVVICVLAVLIVLWSINDLVQNMRLANIYMNWGFWTKLLFIVFGLFILAFQYPTIKYFYLKLRESNQIVLWGEEGEEQELLETGKLKESSRTCEK